LRQLMWIVPKPQYNMNQHSGIFHPAAYLRRLSVAAGIILMTCASGFGMFADGENKAESQMVIGKIHTADTIDPGMLEVAVFTHADSIPHAPLQLLGAPEDGVFSFSRESGASVILEVRGPEGAGRKYVAFLTPGDTVHFNYPVIEEIVFLHTNDHHFDINLIDKFTETVSEIRGQYDDVFLFDAGDVFVRHPHRWIENGVQMNDVSWYAERAKAMIRTMNGLQYHGLTLGNHEFDYV
jgi:hypothetical protein